MKPNEGPGRIGAPWKTGRNVAVSGIVVSGVLAAINLTVGFLAGSTAVVAAGFEFAGDMLASGIVTAGMLAAGKPADQDHPYGHGRAELLAGFLVGLILLAGGASICYHALGDLSKPQAPPKAYAVWALAAAIGLRCVMSAIKFRVGKRIQSVSLVADAWNDLVDVVSALVALAALGLTLTYPDEFYLADRIGGFLVGVVVVLTGVRVAKESSLELMDTMPGSDMISDIHLVSGGVPGVLGVHGARARKTGLQYHVDVHVEVEPQLSVHDGHEIARRVRAALRNNLDWVADSFIHVEPHEPDPDGPCPPAGR